MKLMCGLSLKKYQICTSHATENRTHDILHFSTVVIFRNLTWQSLVFFS